MGSSASAGMNGCCQIKDLAKRSQGMPIARLEASLSPLSVPAQVRPSSLTWTLPMLPAPLALLPPASPMTPGELPGVVATKAIIFPTSPAPPSPSTFQFRSIAHSAHRSCKLGEVYVLWLLSQGKALHLLQNAGTASAVGCLTSGPWPVRADFACPYLLGGGDRDLGRLPESPGC